MNCCFLLEETTQTSADRMAVRKMLNLASAWRSLGFEPQTQQMLWAAVASIASPQRRISLEITLTGTIPMMPTEPKRYWNEICPFLSPFFGAFLGVVVGILGGGLLFFLLFSFNSSTLLYFRTLVYCQRTFKRNYYNSKLALSFLSSFFDWMVYLWGKTSLIS